MTAHLWATTLLTSLSTLWLLAAGRVGLDVTCYVIDTKGGIIATLGCFAHIVVVAPVLFILANAIGGKLEVLGINVRPACFKVADGKELLEGGHAPVFMTGKHQLFAVLLGIEPRGTFITWGLLPHQPRVEVGDGAVSIVLKVHGRTLEVVGVLTIKGFAHLRCINLFAIAIVAEGLTRCDKGVGDIACIGTAAKGQREHEKDIFFHCGLLGANEALISKTKR